MQYREYGKENSDVIVFLHGGGMSWWNFRDAAEQLQSDYRVILPILDGHGGSDREFTTIEENAEEIIAFLDREFGGTVLLMAGVSLGAQILLEILSRRRNVCRYAVVESAMVIPSKLTYGLIKPVFGSCYGLIRRRWFAKAQAAYLRIPESLFEDYYRDTCRISKESMIAFLQENAMYSLKDSIRDCAAQATVLVGEKELGTMKNSARLIHKQLPGSTLQILPGMQHGEYALSHGPEYADILRRIMMP